MTDAITGKPIANMKLLYTIDTRCGVIADTVNCGGSKEYFTDQDGQYYIPRKILFQFPFPPTGVLDEIHFLFNSDNYVSWFERDGLFGKDYNENYLPVKYSFCKKGDRFCKKEDRGQFMTTIDYFQSSFNLDVALIPQVKSPNECQAITNNELKEKCTKQNSYNLAIKTPNSPLCYETYDSNRCLSEVRLKVNEYNVKISEQLYNIIGEMVKFRNAKYKTLCQPGVLCEGVNFSGFTSAIKPDSSVKNTCGSEPQIKISDNGQDFIVYETRCDDKNKVFCLDKYTSNCNPCKNDGLPIVVKADNDFIKNKFQCMDYQLNAYRFILPDEVLADIYDKK